MNPTQIITSLIPQLLAGGGPQVIILLLMVIIGFFWFERKRLMEENRRKEERIESIIEDYKEGNTSLVEAFAKLRMMLAEIKGRVSK